MPTQLENACIQQLLDIIRDQNVSDIIKAQLVREVLADHEDEINVPHVTQAFGAIESPVRLSIINNLPRTFAVFQQMGGEMTQFDRRHRTANHSFADLVALMEQAPAFSTKAPGQFGYGGVFNEWDLMVKRQYTWLHYYLGELDLEIGAERGHAKADMLSAGYRVPVEFEETLIFSRRPSGTLVCTPPNVGVPAGNTVQEYVTDPHTGYRKMRAANVFV